ncbi:hypothetical protein GQX74_006938 [Glossina fuscipes]|nr:hypothetical protein GQX74_006938 [Glossina fuscipes]
MQQNIVQTCAHPFKRIQKINELCTSMEVWIVLLDLKDGNETSSPQHQAARIIIYKLMHHSQATLWPDSDNDDDDADADNHVAHNSHTIFSCFNSTTIHWLRSFLLTSAMSSVGLVADLQTRGIFIPKI